MKLASTTLSAARAPQDSREALKSVGAWWVQFGDELLLYSANDRWDDVVRWADRNDVPLAERDAVVDKRDLHLVVQKGRLFQRDHPDVPVLLDKGRYLVVELDPGDAEAIGEPEEPCYRIEPLEEDSVVFDQRAAPAARAAPVPWIQDLVDDVSRTRFENDLAHLVTFPTRYSTSSHFDSAAGWTEGALSSLGYAVHTETVSVGTETSRNVIAERTGDGSTPRDLLLVVAHLDSINAAGGANADAPGADDNGSGSAGLLEIARVFADHPARHDLRLILFGGEEQGLHGSIEYVASLSSAERARLLAVVNMDMIASMNTSAPTVLLEGDTVSQTAIDQLADSAATYTGLAVQTSLSPYASDHVPFLDEGLPAVLTIEGADGANANVHTAGDTLTHIDYGLALDILRMNVAFIAHHLERHGGITVPDITDLNGLDITAADLLEVLDIIRVRYSGRYEYKGGASTREGERIVERNGHSFSELVDPTYDLEEPIFIPDHRPSYDWTDLFTRLRFTLHIDIDGTDPLDVVSGTVAKGLYLLGTSPPHFIGRVTSNTASSGGRNLVVEDFSFVWPGGGQVIDKLEIKVRGSLFMTPTADVVFVSTASGRRFGPYSVPRASAYFREVEVEVDIEDGGVDPEPYDTHTHPDRPGDLPQENLTLGRAFAKAGILVTGTSGANTVDTSEAGGDNRWTYQELHDSMELHWSAFADVPQWKMWVFLAELGTSDNLGGAMFDADIDGPDGVDRQGTAIFTTAPFFHTTGGAYIQANPPEAEAVERELFFNLVHETGHAFNLYHSFSKTDDTPWSPPSWMPLASDPDALSWMNYPERLSPGYSATAFYDEFRFRFSDDENLFLRHAPASFVRMGDEDWRQNHGRVSRASLDRRLELTLRSHKEMLTLGEPVFLELRLRNIGEASVLAHRNMDPADGFVELAVTKPDGERSPFLPVLRTRIHVETEPLEPGEAFYEAVNLTMGKLGFPFKRPGPYRIEASYQNVDGSTAAAVMQLWVRPPENYEDVPVVSALFNARIGRVLYFGGTRVMEDVNEKLESITERLSEGHPARRYLTSVRYLPMASAAKVVDPDTNRVRVVEADPGRVVKEVGPVIEELDQAAASIGLIKARELVDTYTDAAVASGDKSKAKDAQQRMLELFRERGVLQQVVETVEQRVKELK